MGTKYTFKQEFTPDFNPYGTSVPSTITMELDGDLTLSQLLERFEEFLRGAGFQTDGYLDFVPDEELPQSHNVNGDADLVEHSGFYFDPDRNK